MITQIKMGEQGRGTLKGKRKGGAKSNQRGKKKIRAQGNKSKTGND